MVKVHLQRGRVDQTIVHQHPAVVRTAKLKSGARKLAPSGNEALAISQLTKRRIPGGDAYRRVIHTVGTVHQEPTIRDMKLRHGAITNYETIQTGLRPGGCCVDPLQ